MGRTKKKNTNTNTKFDFTVDEGKEWLNPSREKNKGTHRRKKVYEKSSVTFSSCVTPAGTSIDVQNEWEENTENTHIGYKFKATTT